MKLDTAFSGRSAAGTTAGWPTAITADTDLRLCRFLGLSNGYWLRAQAAYDTEDSRRDAEENQAVERTAAS